MKAYLDASVVLRRLLHQPGAIEDWSRWELLVTSELMRVECSRSLDRLRLTRRMRDTELADVIDAFRRSISGFDQVPIEAAIQERAAGPSPAVIATLDAIHLATALVWIERYEEPLLFVTHDVQLAIAARISGLDVQTTP